MDFSDLLRCPVCFDDFDHDPSLFSTDEEKRSSRLPTLSAKCSHKTCASCLNKWQLVAISKTSAKAKTPKWFECHTCKEMTAFNAVDMKIDAGKCSDVAATRSLMASGSTASEPRPIVALKNDEPECHDDTDDGGGKFASAELILEAGAARRRMPQCHCSSEWRDGSDDNIQRLAMAASITGTSHVPLVDRKRKFLETALEEGKSAQQLKDLIHQEEEMQSVEEFLGNSAPRRIANFHRDVHTHSKRREKKQKESKENCEASNGVIIGSTRITRRSDLNNRLEQVGVGSRVGIFWPLDNVHCPATIIARHGRRWPHTYTFLYDDGEQESFDLSLHQQFQILGDEVPKEALDAIATVGEGGGDQNGTGLDGQGRRKGSKLESSEDEDEEEANAATEEPKDAVDLIKKCALSFISPYANAKWLGKIYPAKNGLTPSIVLHLLENQEGAGMLIDALPKECGLVRDDPNHRNLIRHLYRNFQGEGNLLENKTGDKLPVSLQERDICVYAAVLEKGFDFLAHFIPYRSGDDVMKIYHRTQDKGFEHNEEHVAHVKRTVGLIERLENSLGIEEALDAIATTSEGGGDQKISSREKRTKKRNRDRQSSSSIDEAIAEAMQGPEYAASRNRMAKSARKASVAKSEGEDESVGRKIIDGRDTELFVVMDEEDNIQGSKAAKVGLSDEKNEVEMFEKNRWTEASN